MSSHSDTAHVEPLDLKPYRNLPIIAIVSGIVLMILGFFAAGDKGVLQFGYSWLLAFMFFLSLFVGSFFLTMAHHMFDASWSVPVRRITETMACVAPWLLVLWIPIGLLATKIYPWMGPTLQKSPDHALSSKFPLLSIPGFYIVAAICFFVWIVWTWQLRRWSLRQDETGSAQCTFRMRVWTGTGIFLFAPTVTIASIMWIKALMHEWFSTMYGVWYFAGSVWTTLATVYVICLLLQRAGPLRHVMHEKQYYFLGSLLFAFTVFYAYVTFAQYFIIWNANMPEEVFWYNLREVGGWQYIGRYVIIFGHFFVPFLALLRIDVKLKTGYMIGLAVWVWVMHFFDLQFQIMPSLHKNGMSALGFILDAGCMLFFAGIVAIYFIRAYTKHAPYPQKDPRIAEGLDIYVPPTSYISTAPSRAK
ncbi:MAG: hypothetical protein JWO95_799 [Verrucomicrobiales bacterium]|nr:hypothetical protein [Verrucomicrobiales bacterium]